MWRESQFVAGRREAWAWWDSWTGRSAASRDALTGEEFARVAQRFRQLTHDLALAEDRQYSLALTDSLRARVFRAHRVVHGAAARAALPWRAFITHDFPRLVRAEARLVLASAVLFFGPLLLTLAFALVAPGSVDLWLGPEHRHQLELMYGPGGAADAGRPASMDWTMYGFYIANNVRIDLQCFAGGILFGAGTVFYLLLNGVIIGSSAGHITQIGYGTTFWSFVAGHSAFELTGAVVSGAAGFMLGRGLLAPGPWRRRDALLREARRAVPLLVGAALLTAAAAIVEAFWSPLRGVPPAIKYFVGVLMWALTLGYLAFAGADRPAAHGE